MTRFGLAVLTLAVLVSTSSVAQEDDSLEWLDDYDEAIALARKTGNPLWLEFRCAP